MKVYPTNETFEKYNIALDFHFKRDYWKMRARSKEINVEALHNTQGLHTMERES